MWDLIDQLIADNVIQYPLAWGDINKQSISSVILIQK